MYPICRERFRLETDEFRDGCRSDCGGAAITRSGGGRKLVKPKRVIRYAAWDACSHLADRASVNSMFLRRSVSFHLVCIYR